MKKLILAPLLLVVFVLMQPAAFGAPGPLPEGAVLRLVRPASGQYTPHYVDGWHQIIEASHPDGIAYVQPFFYGSKKQENKIYTPDPNTGYYDDYRRHKSAGVRELYLRMVTLKGQVIETESAPIPIMGPSPNYMGFINIKDGDVVSSNSSFYVEIDCSDMRGNIVEGNDTPLDTDGVQWVKLVIDKGLAGEQVLDCTNRIGSISHCLTNGPLFGLYECRPSLTAGPHTLNIRYESQDAVYDASITNYVSKTPSGITNEGSRITITAGNGPVPPSIPSGFLATAGDGYVRLQWDHDVSGDAATYAVYRANAPSEGSYLLLAEVSPNGSGPDGVNGYVDTSVTNGDIYAYAVKAIDTNRVESFYSDEALATPQAPATTERTIKVANTVIGGRPVTWSVSGLDRASNTLDDAVITASGSVGSLSPANSFSISVSALDNWSGSEAQVAIGSDSFGSYLAGVETNSRGVVRAAGQGAFGVDDASPDVATGALIADVDKSALDGTNEAVVFTIDASGLGPNLALQLTQVNFSGNNGSTANDFVVYAASGNHVLEEAFGRVCGGSEDGTWTLGNGDKIIVAASAGSFRINDLTFKIVDADADNDGIKDRWEMDYFGSTNAIDGTLDSDGDNVKDFFEYLYGSDPTNPLSSGFCFQVKHDGTGAALNFEWEVRNGFALGADYEAQISTNLTVWNDHYSLIETTTNGMNKSSLMLTEDYSHVGFLRLIKKTSP